MRVGLLPQPSDAQLHEMAFNLVVENLCVGIEEIQPTEDGEAGLVQQKNNPKNATHQYCRGCLLQKYSMHRLLHKVLHQSGCNLCLQPISHVRGLYSRAASSQVDYDCEGESPAAQAG